MSFIKINNNNYLNPLQISQFKIEESVYFQHNKIGYKVVAIIFGKSETIKEFRSKDEAIGFLEILLFKVMSNKEDILDINNIEIKNTETNEEILEKQTKESSEKSMKKRVVSKGKKVVDKDVK